MDNLKATADYWRKVKSGELPTPSPNDIDFTIWTAEAAIRRITELRAKLAQPVSQRYKLNSPEIPDSWIACTEQTPDADGAYWCWFGKEEPSVIQQRVCIWISRHNEWCDSSAVTHWMPLPAAPATAPDEIEPDSIDKFVAQVCGDLTTSNQQ
ncbi:DUF551 domain-containing protein [Serratia liquefaciens]|uniref:DUF551 domain-containing protein n=1 Tax=Serratia liquefaciens TaxID=614 RepID=UPI00352496CF